MNPHSFWIQHACCSSTICLPYGCCRQLRLECRPTKEEAAEYVDLLDKAKLLHAKVQDSCMQSQQFAERLITGELVMVESAKQAAPSLSVVLGLEPAIKVIFPSHHIMIHCSMHPMYTYCGNLLNRAVLWNCNVLRGRCKLTFSVVT